MGRATSGEAHGGARRRPRFDAAASTPPPRTSGQAVADGVTSTTTCRCRGVLWAQARSTMPSEKSIDPVHRSVACLVPGRSTAAAGEVP
jgi:hypothetical protein